jgi:hypothetical protein
LSHLARFQARNEKPHPMIDSTLFHWPPVRGQGALVIGGAAQISAVLRMQFMRAGLVVWRGLETQGQARALRELTALAERCEASDPQQAQQLRDASRFITSH